MTTVDLKPALDLTNIGRDNDEIFSKVEAQVIRQHLEDAKAELNYISDSNCTA